MSVKTQLVGAYDAAGNNGHVFGPPPDFEMPDHPVDLREYGDIPDAVAGGAQQCQPMTSREPGEFTEKAKAIATAPPPKCTCRGNGRIMDDWMMDAFNRWQREHCPGAAIVGEPAEELMRELEKQRPPCPVHGGGGDGEFKIEYMTSAEFADADFTVDYLMDGAVPAREPGIVGAPSKSLKTIMAVAGDMSLATGESYLGMFEVPRPIRCGIISAESGFAALQRTAHAIATAHGKKLKEDYANLFWSKHIIDLGNKSHVKGVRSWIEGEGLESITLDPCYLLMPGLGDMANNLFHVGTYLVELTHLVAELNCGVKLVHHFKKLIGEPYQEPELEWLAHAGFVNWARWWWLLNRRTKYDPENRGVHQLWMHFGGSAGHSSAWAVDVDEGLQSGHQWETSIRYASEAREEKQEAQASVKQQKRDMADIAKQNASRAKVEAALKAFPEGSTASDIAAKAKVSNAVAKGVLLDLLERKVVEPCTVIRGNKQPYDGYILSDKRE